VRQEKYIKKNQYKIILIVSLSCLLFMNNTLQKPPTLSLFQQIKKKWTRLERQSTLKQKNIETEIRKWDSWVLEFIKDLKFRREHHETAVGICRGNHIILPQRKYRTRRDLIREIYLTEYDLMKTEKRDFYQEVEISKDLCQLEDLLISGNMKKGIPAFKNSKNRLSLNQLRYLNCVLDRFLKRNKDMKCQQEKSLTMNSLTLFLIILKTVFLIQMNIRDRTEMKSKHT